MKAQTHVDLSKALDGRSVRTDLVFDEPTSIRVTLQELDSAAAMRLLGLECTSSL